MKEEEEEEEEEKEEEEEEAYGFIHSRRFTCSRVMSVCPSPCSPAPKASPASWSV